MKAQAGVITVNWVTAFVGLLSRSLSLSCLGSQASCFLGAPSLTA